MKFSKYFLDKLLNSAINFYDNEPEGKIIPSQIDNINTGILYFTNQIRYEANKALQKEILCDTPLLHAVNLNTKNPGIVSDKTDNKLVIHREKREKKPKTDEQIAKELEKKIEREKQREIKNQIKEEEKKEKKNLKNDEKEIKKKEKNVDKINKKIDKNRSKKDEYEKKISKKEKPTKKDYEKIKNMENDLEELEEESHIINEELSHMKSEYDNRKKTYDDKQEEKRVIREEKKKEREIKKKEREEKQRLKKEEKEKKIAEEERLYMEQLYDIINEQDDDDNDEELLSEVDPNKVSIYQSPLPFQRHLDSLDWVDPHDSLKPALLKGKNTLKGGSLTIFHGPPGTGKTYKLIQTLSNLLSKSKKTDRFLICAASNIGTINLYNRAKTFDISGCLVLSNPKIANASEEETLKWNPKSDQVVFCTVSMRYGSVLNEQKFKTILIDEAAQCQESWTWGLLRNEVRHIYLAGDPHQLPAVVSEEGIELNHDRSLMTRLIELGYPTTLLNIQRRMHPDIVKFSNEQFYDGKLKTNYKKNAKIKSNAFEIIDVKGQEERVGTSYQNKKEAEKIIEIVNKLKIKDTIIISPYQAQCKLLRQLNNKLKVHTVDSFQGREADCVILTTVRSGEKMGFWNDYRRLNVALTRAKHVLRIVGNIETWKKSNSKLKLLCNNL